MENTENKFNYSGVWYIAVEEESCRCCAFVRHDKRCEIDVNYPDDNERIPMCDKHGRKDNRSVIFVESDADNFGDEE